MEEKVLNNVDESGMETEPAPKVKQPMRRETKRIIFYTLMMIFPFAQFLLFYVYVNFSEIMLAFQVYTEKTGAAIGYDITYSVENFVYVYNFVFNTDNSPFFTVT